MNFVAATTPSLPAPAATPSGASSSGDSPVDGFKGVLDAATAAERAPFTTPGGSTFDAAADKFAVGNHRAKTKSESVADGVSPAASTSSAAGTTPAAAAAAANGAPAPAPSAVTPPDGSGDSTSTAASAAAAGTPAAALWSKERHSDVLSDTMAGRPAAAGNTHAVQAADAEGVTGGADPADPAAAGPAAAFADQLAASAAGATLPGAGSSDPATAGAAFTPLAASADPATAAAFADQLAASAAGAHPATPGTPATPATPAHANSAAGPTTPATAATPAASATPAAAATPATPADASTSATAASAGLSGQNPTASGAYRQQSAGDAASVSAGTGPTPDGKAGADSKAADSKVIAALDPRPAAPTASTAAAFISPTVPTDRPAATSSVAGATPAQTANPTQQLVSVLNPVRSFAGTHEINLRLQPEGLGTVDAVVTVTANQVTVQLKADTPEAHQALAAALPQLRHEMGSGGQQADVFMANSGSDFSGNRGSQGGLRQPAGGYGADADDFEPIIPTLAGSASGSSSIDLRL
ncbi:MAG TPA: flagellar hook-length control protein FliK [Acidimicrobiales bacterium]|jgi:Meckel syndrome type 1 protein|nr:flagellar hook-length control protein FliK [Acidimicrobiales bacterium]